MSLRVAVSGASGFVGRALVPLLSDRGCVVEPLGREVSALTPDDAVAQVSAFAPDVVLHLATHFIAAHTPADIPDLVRTNIEWGTVLAEAALAADARFVSIESAWQHVDGADYEPVSLYAATKQAFADVCRYYAHVRGLDVRTVTLFDTYGPGDVRPKLVPVLLNAAQDGVTLDMSDGEQLIDLTYVDDVARGIADVALAPTAPTASVVRSWSPVTVRELHARVEAVVGRPVPVRWGVRPSRPREMRTDWVFGAPPPGWQPSVTLDEGLSRVWRALPAHGTSA